MADGPGLARRVGSVRPARDRPQEQPLHPYRATEVGDRRGPARAADGAPDHGALPRRRRFLSGEGQPGRGREPQAVTIELSDTDLRLVSVRPNRRSLRGAYGLFRNRLREGGSQYVFTLNAAQSIRRGSDLVLTFRASGGPTRP